MKPDYSTYDYAQLIDALTSIDKDKWPERVKEIEAEIQSERITEERQEIENAEIQYNAKQLAKYKGQLKLFPVSMAIVVIYIYFKQPELLSLEGLSTVSPIFIGAILFSLAVTTALYWYYKGKQTNT